MIREKEVSLHDGMVHRRSLLPEAGRLASRAAHATKNSLPQELRQLARQRSSQGQTIYDFSLGEGDGILPGVIPSALAQALHMEHTQYAPAAGLPELRAMVLTWLGCEQYYSPEQVVISAGAAHSLFALFLTLVNPGEVVLLPPASREECYALARWAGVRTYTMPAERSEEAYLKMSKQDLIDALEANPQARMLVLANPCNPTAQVYSAEEMATFAEICADCSVYLVLDRRYWTITFAPTEFVEPNLPERVRPWLVQIDSVSNSFSHAGGLRVGWTIAPPDVTEGIRELQTHLHGSASTLCQVAACAALSKGRDVDYLKQLNTKRLAWKASTEDIPGVRIFPTQGTFYSLWDIRAVLSQGSAQRQGLTSSAAFAEHLIEEHGIMSTPGDSYGLDGYLRFSFSVSEKTMLDGTAALKRAFARVT